MDISDIIIIVCCVINIILLAVVLILLIKKNSRTDDGKELKDQTRQLKEYFDGGSRNVLDQLGRQNSVISDTVRQNVELMGGKLGAEQKTMNESTAAAVKAIGEDVSELKKDNRAGLENIRSIVTDKMQDTLNSRLETLNQTITNSFSELGKGLREEQKNQLNIINQNMDRLREENSRSLEKINGTVSEKLQESLDKRISESFKTVNDQLMNVSRGLGEMQSVAGNISDLKKVLSNVKTRGILILG